MGDFIIINIIILGAYTKITDGYWHKMPVFLQYNSLSCYMSCICIFYIIMCTVKF